ncbi:MAG: DUF1674 domain-containing protein [Steroidobacteraceae bacterium]
MQPSQNEQIATPVASSERGAAPVAGAAAGLPPVPAQDAGQIASQLPGPGPAIPAAVPGSSLQPATPAGGPAGLPREIGGRDGPEPTRFGDWEKAGRCIDF